MIVGVMLLVAGPYWWRDTQAKQDRRENAEQIAELQAKVTELEAKAAEQTEDEAEEEPKASASDVKENIAAAISSGNTAALQGYMAQKVRVIIAASEGVGDRTPAQAISDLKYLDSATDPWNFNLNDTTLAQYGAGGYGQYFPAGAVVGRSADDKVVSFTFDAGGKISGIFMAADAELLSN